MKLSRYNHIIEYNNSWYIYNAFKKSVVLLNVDLLKKIQEGNLCGIKGEILTMLIQCGMVLNDNEDEIELIKYCHNKTKYDMTQCSYIVYPTLACNLSCPYCFEKTVRKTMDDDRLRRLKSFFKEKVKTQNISTLHIRWSGGEPLLMWKYIKEINSELNILCKQNKVKYSTSLCTNATLLTEDMAKDVYENNFDTITISIDGPDIIHDQRRFYKYGIGSYSDVVGGINNVSKYQKVILRVNVDKNNLSYFVELLQDLDLKLNNKQNVSIYLKPVLAAYKCDYDESLFDDTEYFDVEKKLLNDIAEFHFQLHFDIQHSHFTRCVAYQDGSYLIDPELQLFKCPLHIGHKKERVGFIDDKSKIVLDNITKHRVFINSNPFDNEECLRCNILPLCNGKCLVKYRQLCNGINQGCISEKETLETRIRNFILPKYVDNV